MLKLFECIAYFSDCEETSLFVAHNKEEAKTLVYGVYEGLHIEDLLINEVTEVGGHKIQVL